MTPYVKTIARSIRQSFGRFFAILSIIALGVGFFAGLTQTSPSFYLTGRTFIKDHRLFDYRLISTIGFDEPDIEKISELDGVSVAEGAYFTDVMTGFDDESEDAYRALRIHSVTEDVNILKLQDGRLPEAEDEIVLDGYRYGSDVIGKTLILGDDGKSSDGGRGAELRDDRYTVVGLVRSPLYLNFQRGTTDVGNGKLDAYAFVLPEAFDSQYFTECYLYCDSGYEAYTEAYDEWAEEFADDTKEDIQNIIEDRYDRMRAALSMMARTGIGAGLLSESYGTDDEPEVYILGRDTNVGYLSFDNDAGIVEGIAKVFPVFFFAIAALVCSTTMQRMVSDERGIIGTMRALGYSDFSIIMKYVIYSGLAAATGAFAGYAAGIRIFPLFIWEAYGMMYGFSDLILKTSSPVFIASLGVSLICSSGVAYVTAAGELSGMPAELIRPKAPAAGKKILIEKLTFIWKHIRFDGKVSLRNVFRFKKRMWMMLLGIAGCSALLITGFGIRDTITGVVDLQYDNITVYDLEADLDGNIKTGTAVSDIEELNSRLGTDYKAYPVRVENITHNSPDMVRDVTLLISSEPDITEVLKGTSEGETMPWPGDGQIAISSKLASKNNLSAGDDITFTYDDGAGRVTVRVAYVFDNYIYHFAYMNEATYEQAFGEKFEPSALLLRSETSDPAKDYEFARELSATGDFGNITVTEQGRESFSQTMRKLNVIVVLIIACAAALAFIVLFNLNNINITERIREIATIKVLGFSRRETGAYFFRESFILVFMGFFLGIPAGIALHRFVIAQIEMDTVTFPVRVLPVSYLYSFLFVVLFSLLVDLVMRVKIEHIDMAESLKSSE